MSKNADNERYTKTPHDLLGRVPPAAFAVWTALGVHADRKTGECHPSMGRLARLSGISRQHIGRLVVALERAGRLDVERKPNGVVTRYRLIFEGQERPSAVAEGTPVSAEGTPVSAEGTPVSAEGTPVSAPIKGVNQSQELESGTIPAATGGDERSAGDAQKPKPLFDDDPPKPKPEPSVAFDEFYQPYPRKVGRKDAERAWKKLSTDEKRRAVVAATTYRNATNRWPKADRRFIPHPATWLNQGRFDDDPAEWARTAGTDPRQAVREQRNQVDYPRGRDFYQRAMESQNGPN